MTVPSVPVNSPPWPSSWLFGGAPTDETLADLLLYAATETVHLLSGQQFGIGRYLDAPLVGGQMLMPIVSPWLPATYGSCQVATLRPHVQSVESVTLCDGTNPPFEFDGWRLYDTRYLIRTDGQCWPHQQTQQWVRTGGLPFVVAYYAGMPVPKEGLMAVAEMAKELALAVAQSDVCRLDRRVQNVVRQGISISYVDPMLLTKAGMTGLSIVDDFVNAVNPHHQLSAPAVVNPDALARVMGYVGGTPRWW
jgi:hypothetical protein